MSTLDPRARPVPWWVLVINLGALLAIGVARWSAEDTPSAVDLAPAAGQDNVRAMRHACFSLVFLFCACPEDRPADLPLPAWGELCWVNNGGEADPTSGDIPPGCAEGLVCNTGDGWSKDHGYCTDACDRQTPCEKDQVCNAEGACTPQCGSSPVLDCPGASVLLQCIHGSCVGF